MNLYVTLSVLTALASVSHTYAQAVYTIPSEFLSLVDAAPNITAFIKDSVPDNSIIDFGGALFPGNTFVSIVSRTGLLLRNGGLVRTHQGDIVYPHANPHLAIDNCSDITVVDFVVHGTNNVSDVAPGFGSYTTTYAFEAAILCGASSNLFVSNLTVNAVWGDGMQVEGCQNVSLINSFIDKNGRQGVSMSHGAELTVRNVTILHSRRAGVDLEPNVQSNVAANVTLENMLVGSWLLSITSGGPGTVSNVRVHNVTVWRSAAPVFNVAPSGADGVRNNWTFSNVTTLFHLDAPEGAFIFRNARDGTVKDCTVPIVTSRSRIAVEMSNCGGTFNILDNNFLPGGNITYTSSNPQSDLQVVSSGNVPPMS